MEKIVASTNLEHLDVIHTRSNHLLKRLLKEYKKEIHGINKQQSQNEKVVTTHKVTQIQFIWKN